MAGIELARDFPMTVHLEELERLPAPASTSFAGIHENERNLRRGPVLLNMDILEALGEGRAFKHPFPETVIAPHRLGRAVACHGVSHVRKWNVPVEEQCLEQGLILG